MIFALLNIICIKEIIYCMCLKIWGFYVCVIDIRCLTRLVFSSWRLCCRPAGLPRCHRGGSDIAGAHPRRGGGLPAEPQEEDRRLPVPVREAGQRWSRGHSHYAPKSVRLWSFSGANGHFHLSLTCHFMPLTNLIYCINCLMYGGWSIPLK